MLVDTNNLVSAEQFCQEMDKYVAAAREGAGPVAVLQDSEIVGFFIGPDEYEAMFGVAVKDLLSSRTNGPKVTHKQAKARIKNVIDRQRKS